MTIPKGITNNKGLYEWSILSFYRGSIAHGMYTPKTIDDKDVMSVCVPDKEYYYGLKIYGSRGTKEIKKDEWDIVIYEVRKFLSLLAQGNPNVLCSLWLDKNYYINITPAGQLILSHEYLFVGKHAYRSFAGYARSQRARMTRYSEYHGHMGKKRKELVDKFGYDCKNAAHLIRLLRMGVEFLKEGRLYVLRHDAKELLSIKRGEWLLEDVNKEAEHWFKLLDEAYIKSELPDKPDYDKINGLAIDIIETAYKERMLI